MPPRHPGIQRLRGDSLLQWLDAAVARAREVADRAGARGVRTVFTISSTSKPARDGIPYLTPLRQNSVSVYSGAVVFTQDHAVDLCRRLDGLVDYVLVDAEKKIPITVDEEAGDPHPGEETVVPTRSGNLTQACYEHISRSRFYEFKPNDITANAVWHLVSRKLRFLSGRRFAIVGCGNIGFKLALKLLESNATVNVVRRDAHAGFHLAHTMNLLKPPSTVAHANFTTDGLKAAYLCDALIGCSQVPRVVDFGMISSLRKGAFVVDVGKGNLTPDAVRRSLAGGIEVIRADITSALDGEIVTIMRNERMMEEEMGRREVSGLNLVSGGVFGLAGDLVVDRAAAPSVFFGVSDGEGELKQPGKLTPADRRAVRRLRSLMESRGGR